jgi:hypothetical protein
MKFGFMVRALSFSLLSGSLCLTQALAESTTMPIDPIKPCATSEDKDPGSLQSYIDTIDLASLPKEQRCKAPATYVEIQINPTTFNHFCTIANGLVPVVSKQNHKPNSGYRLRLADYLSARAMPRISAEIKRLNLQEREKKAKLVDLYASWKEAHYPDPDGRIKTGVVFGLAGRIPEKYHSIKDKDGKVLKHLGIMETIGNYRKSLQEDIDAIDVKIREYGADKLAEKVTEAASNFSDLAQMVLLNCPAEGGFNNPVHSCIPSDAKTNETGAKDDPVSNIFSAELAIVQDHDDALKGTGYEDLRIENLFQQGNLHAGNAAFLACNDFFQNFGVSRFGCETASGPGNSKCHILADGALAFSGKEILGPETYKAYVFGKLTNELSSEEESNVRAKPGDTELATGTSGGGSSAKAKTAH